MSEFDSTVTLNVEIDDRSLANARDEIEDELGGVESAVAADTGAGGGGGAGRQRRRRRLEFRWARENNENLAEILDVIDDAEFGGGGGGGIAGELLGAAGETAGDVAIETGDTVADALSDVVTGTISSTLGNTISDAINGSTLSVERPPWVPLQVEDIDGGGGGRPTVDLSTTFDPTIEPTFEPTFNPELSLPDVTIGGGTRRGGRDIQTPHPVTIENTPVDVSLQDGVGGGGVTIDISSTRVAFAGAGGSTARGVGPLERSGNALDELAGRAGRAIGLDQNLDTGILGDFGRFADRVNPTINPEQGGGGTTEVSQGDINVTVQADTDSIVSDVRQELEREFGRQLDQLDRRLSDVEEQLDRASGGTRGGRTGASPVR